MLNNISLKDAKIITSVLEGNSVLDWHRLYFETREEVIQFLEINGFNLSKSRDKRRIEFIFKNAITYLRNIHSLYISDSFKKENIIDIFLYASNHKKYRKDAEISCAILKVMNIINHIDSQDLVTKIQIERQTLLKKVEKRINKHIQMMRTSTGLDFEFQLSIKERDSIISKFLTKKEGIVARIFDRIRFRIITETKEEIIPVMNYLFSNLFPYNYVIPSETTNNLISIEYRENSFKLSKNSINKKGNKFSGPSYKVLNFIVDIPVRIDDILILPNNSSFSNHAYIIYILTEIQIIDKQTYKNNKEGENSHELYKGRQKKLILERLLNKKVTNK